MIALSANPWLSLVALVFVSPPECRADDAGWFPEYEVTKWGHETSCAAWNYLENHPPLGKHKTNDYYNALADQRWRMHCWVHLYQARWSYEHESQWYANYRQGPSNLRQLRFLIGDDAYFAGRMPPPIGGY